MSESDYRRLRKRVAKCLEKSLGPPPFVPQVMIGAGGTFLALANISMRRRGKAFSSVGGYELDRSEVRHILDYLRRLSLRDRKGVPGLNADRADIIVAGLTVIERLMKQLQVNRLLIHDQGVRDGLLQRMIGQAFRQEPGDGESRSAGRRAAVRGGLRLGPEALRARRQPGPAALRPAPGAAAAAGRGAASSWRRRPCCTKSAT